MFVMIKKLFIGEIKQIKGFALNGVDGPTFPVGIGTIGFKVRDSHGTDHHIELKNTIYLPQCPQNLISIARWSEDRQDNCGIFSRGKYSIFLWNDDKFKRLIHHQPTSPIPIMSVNEGEDDKVVAFLSGGPVSDSPTVSVNDGIGTSSDVAQQTTQDGLLLPIGHVVRHYEDNEMKVCQIINNKEKINNIPASKIRPLSSKEEMIIPNAELTSVNDPEPSNIPLSPNEINPIHMNNLSSKVKELWDKKLSDFSDDEKLMGYWHRRLRCLPKKYLRRLAKRGCIPCRLQYVRRMPLCAACAFADASKRSSKKGDRKSIRKKDDKPGSGTSCDHLISHEPGLIPQVTGRLIYAHYAGAIVFSDHFSDFTYPHMIRSTSMEETMMAKRAYERMAREYGVAIQHYRADNLRFNDVEFQKDCKKNGQTFNYCGVGAHHQNGIAEAKNKILTYGARKLLLNAKRHWPSVIKRSLWPFALLADAKRHNELSLNENGKSPLELFSGIEDEITCKDFHTCGCPVFVLHESNQSGLTSTPKWDPRARAGIYLGHSPSHAGNVSLFLNLQTDHVSPPNRPCQPSISPSF